MTTSHGSGPERARFAARGQSEVVGVVLIMGIMLVGAAAVVGLGATALGGTESQLSDDRAEKTLTQFDSKAGLVALGEASSQQISVPTETGEQYRVDEDAGWLRVSVTNLSDEDENFNVMNATLGKLVYEHEDTTMAYQGGGVWRANDQGGSMVSPPEFHYRNGTLTLPAITVAGDSSLGSNINIENVDEQRKFPTLGNPDRMNPLDNHRVEVTVQSDYYRGWGQYFVTRTDGSVEYDHANETVTVTLVTPINVNEITAASASLSAGGEFHVSGTSDLDCGGISGEDDIFTSSYNSSKGEGYCEQFEDSNDPLHERLPGTNGDVVYGKDVDISDGSGGSNFYGDVTSGETVTIDDSEGSGQPDVFGNISFVDDCLTDNESTDCSQRIHEDSDGQVIPIDSVPLTESIDWFIDTSLEDIEAQATNNPPDITDGQTLTDGEYYYESFELSNDDTVELDTSDGPVIIGVEDDVTISEDATLSVTGDNHVEIYVGGTDSGLDFDVKSGAEITAPHDNATMFRVYGKSDFEAEIGDGQGSLGSFTGVIYAPPGSAGTGSVAIRGGMVFGGILTGETELDKGSIHYDEALEGERVVPEEARIIRVTYLHVSESTISVTG